MACCPKTEILTTTSSGILPLLTESQLSNNDRSKVSEIDFTNPDSSDVKQLHQKFYDSRRQENKR